MRDQDDPDHVAGVTQWTERRNFEDYLAWRTERGFNDTFEAMLTQLFVIYYYDIAYCGGQYIALAQLEGNFPGRRLDVHHRCTILGEAVNQLEIGLSLMGLPTMPLELGTFGAWFNPVYDEATRIRFVVEAEALGYRTAWLGMGDRAMPDLTFAERALDAPATIIVATAIINVWTNDAATIARSYHRIAVKHPARFLLGIGIGHPESISKYRNPLEILARYLDVLDVEGVTRDRRVLAALGDRALRLSAERDLGSHPYLVVPEHTRHAREILGDGPLLAPEHKAVVSTDVQHARVIGRGFLRDPYFRLSNYTNNLLRYGFTKEDFVEGGSDRAVDALVLYGTPESIKAGVAAHVSAGASHVSVQVLTEPGKDPMPGYRSLARVLF